jgi:hypothetical protein
MTIKVEKGIPIPARGSNRGSTYPYKQLEVGDSFYVKGKTAAKFSASAYNQARKAGIKVTVRNEKDGVRVWRTA